MNKLLINCFIISLILAVFTSILEAHPNWDLTSIRIGWFLLIISEIIALLFIARKGTIHKTRLWIVFKLILLGYTIGVIFKILHLPGASLIISIFLFSLGIAYFVRFILKKEKMVLDYLKVLFVGTFPMLVFDIYPFIMESISHALVFIMMVLLIIENKMKNNGA